MAKKLSLLIAASAAILAFTIPSTAGAASATCGSTPSLCAVGTQITRTGTNIELDTQFLGSFKCTGLNTKVKVIQNSGGIVKFKGESEKPTQTGCTASEGGSTEVTEVNVTNVEAAEADGPSGAIKKGLTSFITKIKLPSGPICTFTATNVATHYVSTASPAVLTSTDAAKDIPSTGGCGKAQLTGSWKLETISGSTATPVILH